MSENIKFNIGEWSELYVMLQVMTDARLKLVDGDLESLNIFYSVVKIIADRFSDGDVVFHVSNPLVLEFGGLKYEIEEKDILFAKHALGKEILVRKNKKKGAFEIREILDFLNKIDIKIKSSSLKKYDIKMQINDPILKNKPILKYSIKSKLGNPATLINASAHTNIRFSVTGLTAEDIKIINSIKSRTKLKDRYAKIIELGGKIKYKSFDSKYMESNLIMLDGDLPSVIGFMVLYSYEIENKRITDLIDFLTIKNPLGYDLSMVPDIYTRKIAKLMQAFTFGMTPSVVSLEEQIDGGLIVVKEEGDVVLLDKVYYSGELNRYLLKSTKLDTPSTTRYPALEIKILSNGEVEFFINLQVRFI